jgi:DNA repair photolyase
VHCFGHRPPPPGARIAALRAVHDRGIFTWVSLKPIIDVEALLAIVDAAHRLSIFARSALSTMPITKTTDWRDYTLRMIDKLHALRKAHYIKKDLQPYLPPGYHNPLRVP